MALDMHDIGKFFSKNLTWLDSFRYNYYRKSFGSAFNHHG